MSHTPGPWIAAWDKDDHNCFINIWANGCDIAFLPSEEHGYECGANKKTLEANGKLMAAAPELLEALKLCAMLINKRVTAGNASIDFLKIRDLAFSAIAKATGDEK